MGLHTRFRNFIVVSRQQDVGDFLAFAAVLQGLCHANPAPHHFQM